MAYTLRLREKLQNKRTHIRTTRVTCQADKRTNQCPGAVDCGQGGRSWQLGHQGGSCTGEGRSEEFSEGVWQ